MEQPIPSVERALPRFTQAWCELGAVDDPGPVVADLLVRWTEPHRHYHTLAHLEHCIDGLDTHRALAKSPSSIEIALWFHDAIYDPRSSDNEARSAALARAILSRAKVAAPLFDRIEQLILATRAHEPDGNADTALLLDLDLAVLGASPADYGRYAEAIRREYAWVPETDYRTKRAAVLQRFLARPALFLTAPFRQRLEASARKNLADEIDRLRTQG